MLELLRILKTKIILSGGVGVHDVNVINKSIHSLTTLIFVLVHAIADSVIEHQYVIYSFSVSFCDDTLVPQKRPLAGWRIIFVFVFACGCEEKTFWDILLEMTR